MKWSADRRELGVKVVVAGAPDSGKAEVLQAIAARYGAGRPAHGRAAGVEVWHSGWSERERLSDGRSLRIALVAPRGRPAYEAAGELLMREADAVLFVIDVDPLRLREGWDALLEVSGQAQRAGFELRSIPLVLQYHRAERHKGFEPEKLDDWLGVPTDLVPRFVTSSASPDAEGMAFDVLLERLLARLEQGGVMK